MYILQGSDDELSVRGVICHVPSERLMDTQASSFQALAYKRSVIGFPYQGKLRGDLKPQTCSLAIIAHEQQIPAERDGVPRF